ncbi:MAG: hypothetical protein HND44_07510 [Chloroflexi bacterium]|nr:hypothetical protein [Ardenticatenaceae bacterium]MBL1128335.1 hypothetical protein [Chloroflexota bacterium]NOG34410.1 hypothetical protein [Chloroflexota bacterium]GIK55961.1 MAG: hypothetical protein BroJett015_16240 [Chloroflexota bacterium]
MKKTISHTSIKSLYTLALAEGEGVGTAYEYFAKRLVLRSWLPTIPPVKRLLIAGLPEKYGCSLDYLLLAEELGATAVVADDRPAAMDKFQTSWAKAQQMGWLTAVSIDLCLVPNMAEMAGVTDPFDLAISNEVIQRLATAERLIYVQKQQELATAVALFCPNAANPDHAAHSGLSTLHLSDLPTLSPGHLVTRSGYIDMPPFPTGVSRSAEQRAQAESGTFEALVMWGLGYFARLERWLPTAVRRQKSHIIYILTSHKA